MKPVAQAAPEGCVGDVAPLGKLEHPDLLEQRQQVLVESRLRETCTSTGVILSRTTRSLHKDFR